MSKNVQSIERAAAVLRSLARAPEGQGLVELARSLGLPKGTTHGIVRTLQAVGFADQDRRTARYHLGASLLDLGNSYLDTNELRSCAINWSDPLASRTGAAVRLGRLINGEVMIVHHVFRPDDTVQVLEVGALLPSHASALGKVLLAFDPTAVGSLEGDELPRYTHRTVARRSDLVAELERIRERGWASEREEYSLGEAGIAAPIRDNGGLVVAAVGIAGTPHTLFQAEAPRASLVAQVLSTAEAISREVGGRRS
jgi:DNA-binding IclR family transcriptional regulator